MGQGKQAKVLTETQIKAVLAAVDGRRYPKRDRVMVLLSIRAGLRAKEIAMARWSMRQASVLTTLSPRWRHLMRPIRATNSSFPPCWATPSTC